MEITAEKLESFNHFIEDVIFHLGQDMDKLTDERRELRRLMAEADTIRDEMARLAKQGFDEIS